MVLSLFLLTPRRRWQCAVHVVHITSNSKLEPFSGLAVVLWVGYVGLGDKEEYYLYTSCITMYTKSPSMRWYVQSRSVWIQHWMVGKGERIDEETFVCEACQSCVLIFRITFPYHVAIAQMTSTDMTDVSTTDGSSNPGSLANQNASNYGKRYISLAMCRL